MLPVRSDIASVLQEEEKKKSEDALKRSVSLISPLRRVYLFSFYVVLKSRICSDSDFAFEQEAKL